jgi:hypothetical protein
MGSCAGHSLEVVIWHKSTWLGITDPDLDFTPTRTQNMGKPLLADPIS